MTVKQLTQILAKLPEDAKVRANTDDAELRSKDFDVERVLECRDSIVLCCEEYELPPSHVKSVHAAEDGDVR